MLAKAIEKIQELTNAQENCRVEECDIFGERYIHQGEIKKDFNLDEKRFIKEKILLVSQCQELILLKLKVLQRLMK